MKNKKTSAQTIKKSLVALFVGSILAGGLTQQARAVDYDYSVETTVTIALTVYEQGEETEKTSGAIKTTTAKVIIKKVTNRSIIDEVAEYEGITFSKSALLLMVTDYAGDRKWVIRDKGREDHSIESIESEIYGGFIEGVLAYTRTENSNAMTVKEAGTGYGILNLSILGVELEGFVTGKYTYASDETAGYAYTLSSGTSLVSGYSEGTTFTGTIKFAGKLIKKIRRE